MEMAAIFFYAARMNDVRTRRRKAPSLLPVYMGVGTSNLRGPAAFAAQNRVMPTGSDMVQMTRGIQLYQNHPYDPSRGLHAPVWSYETSQIMVPHAVTRQQGQSVGRALLLIPSLVNKATILDLIPERSFLRWMCAQGIDTYLFDWGSLSTCEESVDMDYLIRHRLIPAIEHLSDSTGAPIDLLGYCMGGTLSLAASMFCAERINKIVLLAAPWDFHAGHPVLSRHVRSWAPSVLPVIQQKGFLPAEWTQALFASLDAQDVVQKFCRFSSMPQRSEKAKLFVAVEDWLNDGCDLPGDVARHCIQEWFSKNAPAKGQWIVNGRCVDIGSIEKDVLVVASDRDRLVPYESAVIVCDFLPAGRAQILKKSHGHVGAIAGSNSVSSVWKPIRNWLLGA